MMPFIGVRISWLMLARKSLFARLAASAFSFASKQFDLGLTARIELPELTGHPHHASAFVPL
jgi:hypothetical protein